jgi:hypothetical protein
LLVGFDDDATRQPQLCGERSRRRQRRISGEPPGPDAFAEILLELVVQGQRIVAAQVHEELEGGTGLRSGHGHRR